MVIRHGELSDYQIGLQFGKKKKAVFRPTVHYAYMPCHETLSSIYELRGRNYVLPPKIKNYGR